jgi:transposase InsO family protein
LETHLGAELTLAALHMALAAREVRPGLVHHSDRGVQYACGDYTSLLQEHGIGISMSRRGNPYDNDDNAQAQSFIKTLKYEEVYLNEYENLAQARSYSRHVLILVTSWKQSTIRSGCTRPWATCRPRSLRPRCYNQKMLNCL